ncbi:unnamed protein product [Ranitomeya imitator]|uniref:ZZ-type zinc finger-containing protein 3 n=1 Tax=Ranitomeya imitator TaxID=111125 RepID=A0ABN9M348_9NEOB|nr:unnamed protein product [Ranitomeya imitator]
MGKTSDLTDVKKAIIDTLKQEGKTQKDISQQIGCSQSAVSRHLNGKSVGRKQCGRKRCTTRRGDRTLRKIVEKDRFQTLGNLRKQWTESGVETSRATVHRRVCRKWATGAAFPSYQRLLQTISVLEAQRSQAVLDMERLSQHQSDAVTDPIGFVEKLQEKVDVGIPRPQRIVQLPEISWDQYTTTLGNFEREFRNRKRNSRRVKLIFDKVGLHSSPQQASDQDGESTSYSVLPQSDSRESSASSVQIRGRLCMDSKPGTFNQLWTIEEQKKLEQLLLKFPPEEIESKRWQKIADELGNRTAKQVASRVQKYFIKLTKAGIPVPGRTPNLYMYSKKASSKRQHVLNKHLFKPSTFMTSHEPPVFMEEDDDHSSCHNLDAAEDDDDISDEESIPTSFRGLAEYKELLELKRLKKQRLQEMEAASGFVQHLGFKCDNCGIEPIQGIRWHCQDCPLQMAVDFCDSCSDCCILITVYRLVQIPFGNFVIAEYLGHFDDFPWRPTDTGGHCGRHYVVHIETLYETQSHKEDHHLEPVYKAETFLDRDYCMPHSTSYNYLDPNYFPANR